ncbi:TrmH family RNA methyltransferase [Rhodopirellula sp. MGV]|uniref:TrmH family RNA methyltransferase n=1 Tax=Rhodopirellula sp. MGV TaxID=2023130 RepID=UPI000B96DBA8|nr:RNA methyltransferase [Rhodopirellula sp. MGV]OYP38835.1 hypothetical protein CGZ80_01035 [Rhodopirellula sp. MGV]PNY37645.1 RNA methyltransferase [Rhodopirellula baltica]
MSSDDARAIRCTSLDDPRLADYRNLKNRPAGRQRGRSHFVVEGRKLGERLIQSGFPIRSILVEEGFDLTQLPLHLRQRTGADFPIYELPEELISEIAGFHFHRGLLASANLPDDVPLEQLDHDAVSLAFVGISDMENVGSMLRSAAAFGIRQILVDSRSVDPFSRRAMRVSMGAALTMRVFRLGNVADDLATLADRRFHTLAATLADDSTSIETYRTRYNHGDYPCVLVMGNEGQGLPPAVQRACSHRVRISMRPTEQGAPLLDSLNVSVAAAILMHDLTKPS